MSAEPAKRRIIRWGALGIGVILFFGTLYYINFRLAFGTIRQLGIALRSGAPRQRALASRAHVGVGVVLSAGRERSASSGSRACVWRRRLSAI